MSNLDFFVLQSSPGAGRALARFLSAHPQITMPARDATDLAFQNDREGSLDLGAANPSNRHGMLLQHPVQLEPGMPHRVAQLAKPDATFVQLVRDPVETVRAMHRRHEFTRVRNALAARIGRPSLPAPPQGIDTPEKIYDWLSPRLHYHHQGARYASSFAKWRLVDAAELRDPHVSCTLSSLYADLGVDPGFRSPLFQREFHGTATHLLEFSQQPLVVSGANINVRLCRSRDVQFNEDGFTRELLKVEVKESALGFELGDTSLSLVMTDRMFQHLPRPIREVLPNNGILNRHLRENLLPQWMEHAEHIHREVEHRLSEAWPESLHERMLADLEHDHSALFHQRAELARNWTPLHELAGAEAMAV